MNNFSITLFAVCFLVAGCVSSPKQPEADAANEKPLVVFVTGDHEYSSEATMPGHLRGDEEAMAGENAGEVLEGEAPIAAALAELKKPVAVAKPAPPKG